MSIVSYIGYQQTTIALKDDVSKNLKQASTLSIGFIQNWFEYRLMDISIQAESSENIKLLQSLKNGLKQSGKPLKDYVKSFDWTLRTDGLQDNLISLSRRYDYIYDLFLLDTEGNLLFTVAHELDFGTNMLSGIYSNTLFSNSIKKTLESGEIYFSDLERYAPSDDIFAGFITAPLLDENGEKLGVFAMQIRVNKIFEAVRRHSDSDSSLVHYLVGEDGRLRSSMRKK